MPLFDRLMERRSISPQTLFGTGLDTLMAGRTNAGVNIDYEAALSFNAVWACVRLLAGDISTMPLDAFRRLPDGSREEVAPQPRWLKQPDPFDPSVTRIDHMAQVAISLLLDGNAFVLCTPSVDEPIRMQVLNPRWVDVKKPGTEPEYKVRGANGRLLEGALTPADIVHIPINRKPGELRGMSPVMANSETIGIGLAAERYISNFFGQGALVPGFIELPPGTNDTDAALMKKGMESNHRGWRHAGMLGYLFGGAKFSATGITPKDADLTSIQKWQLEQAARAYGIPPFMVGSQEPAGVAYASSVERSQHYIDHCLMHFTGPIELGYDRLVPGDSRLRVGGSDTYVKFNYNALLRGNPTERADWYTKMWQIGAYTVNDILRHEDEKPIGALGDTHYFASSNYAPLGTPPAAAPVAQPTGGPAK